MRDLVIQNFEHTLAVLILLARLGDVGSTYLLTPKLKLEANPIVRRLRWRFALLSLLLCFVPYVDTAAAMVILVVSVLVTVSNTRGLWFARALGEDRYYQLVLEAAENATVKQTIFGFLLSAGFMSIFGLIILFFYPDPQQDWGFWIGLGVLIYAGVLFFYHTLYFFRLRKIAISKGIKGAGGT